MANDIVLKLKLTKRRLVVGAAAAAIGSAVVYADVPNAFNSGDVLSSQKLNANFAALVDRTSNQSIAGNKTFTGNLVVSNGVQQDLNLDPGAPSGPASFYISTAGGEFGANSSMVLNVPSGNGFELAQNGGDSMVLTPQGRVGIATTTPATALQVSGDIRVGTTGTTGCIQNVAGGALVGTCSSDVRFKQNIVAITGSLDKVTRLRPVTYEWRRGEFPDRAFGPGRTYGLIAQEAEEVAPELVSTDAKGYKAVSYGVPLEMMALEAIKELRAENAELKMRLVRVESQLAAKGR